MKIACYTITYNEELMLPHFIKHYKQFCDKIVVYDNMSTDRTKQIALDNGCEVISWEAPGGGLNDNAYIQIKSNCYKQDKDNYDWVITVDCDEFYTHKNGVDKFLSILIDYKNKGITLPKVQGYNMVSRDHNFFHDFSTIKDGVLSESYSKRCIFNPKLNITWDVGCHEFKIIGNKEIESDEVSIILKHYKFINLDNVINKSKEYKNGLSNFNLQTGVGYQYCWSEEKWAEYFEDLLKNCEVV